MIATVVRRRRTEARTAKPGSLTAPVPGGLAERLRSVFSAGTMDERSYREMEEALLASDLGVEQTERVVGRVRSARPSDPSQARAMLRDQLIALFDSEDRSLNLGGHPAVIIVVGVNGAGKTTTVAKLAHYLKSKGLEPLLGAADTYRAAADAQLRVWAGRLGVQLVGGSPRSDPAAVAFDAVRAATARGLDAVVIDTSGRLHSRHNLMEELGKISRVLGREAGEVGEVLLVLDASTGQNGLTQAREFASAAGVTGIVLTKLDGSARGGVAAAAEHLYRTPVKFVGVGEGLEDLVPFDPERFVSELLEGR